MAMMATRIFISRCKTTSLIDREYEDAAADAVLIAADLLERTEKRERESVRYANTQH
jgi:hypothetical protein